MHGFLQHWHEAALTSVGFFWMALWAFALGYLISSLIQVLVTRRRMQRAMGRSGPKSMALGTFFGFISSSCSFAALATTRALFRKGAGLAPSLAFLLASTNLVIELGIVIALFLGWQFVVGEYVGGLLLILFAWAFVRLTRPTQLIEEARQRAGGDDADDDGETQDWRRMLCSHEGWRRIGRTYVMEWQMVWKDVLIGFTVAGIIAAFVPTAFFAALFVGSGGADAANPGLLAVLAQTLVGPVAAFFTFIGSMGNIPLAALLYERGVSFAGVMAFIFSDLVVLPVLRINAAYYGWKMALYILAVLLSGLVVVSLALHYGLLALDLLPSGGAGQLPGEREFFALNTGFVLNLVFLAVSALLGVLWWRGKAADDGHDHHHHEGGDASVAEWILRGVTVAAALWLIGGLVLAPALAAG
ncbi:permease [Denitromonas iodatirespirans]|uniref:Permease n=1 Tax=Denitromonas iodatirespirans TaxID=2795389 RepID=A0A944D7C0_DENI1|nr:permease [Denitromonas iodatirespirans]MBT0959851.1 permease [Denitromonas iodatirespirans]